MEQKIKYRVFKIPKRKGGFRKIEEPVGDGMKILQDKLAELEKIKELKPSYFCHSFMRGRNIVTCAKQHCDINKKGKVLANPKVLIRLDITDFFPSVTWENFYETVLERRDSHQKDAKEDERLKQIHEDIKICFKFDKKKKVHYLPQGAPTSPFLSNAYLRRFDWECAWFAYRNGIVYNRYADDLYLSSKDVNKKNSKLWSTVFCIHNKLKQLHLEENKPKRKVMYPGKRMNVVGVIINENYNIPKRTRRVIRAIKHNAEKNKKELTSEQKGLLAFENMVKSYPKNIKNNMIICKEYELLDKI